MLHEYHVACHTGVYLNGHLTIQFVLSVCLSFQFAHAETNCKTDLLVFLLNLLTVISNNAFAEFNVYYSPVLVCHFGKKKKRQTQKVQLSNICY